MSNWHVESQSVLGAEDGPAGPDAAGRPSSAGGRPGAAVRRLSAAGEPGRMDGAGRGGVDVAGRGGIDAEVNRLVKTYADELVMFRRDLHAHPEPGREEVRTTRLVAERLAAAGLSGRPLPAGTGLVCDVGPVAGSGGEAGADDPKIALRADLDALRVTDEKQVPYRSTRPGLCHACGHDVHTAVVLGAGLVLADLAATGVLRHSVRLVFQPAEEIFPGGALDVIEAGGLKGIERIFAVHCDPRLVAGTVGLRTGALTAAADLVRVRLTGAGGHTARPHLTGDLVHALSTLVSQLPVALSRRVDPRAGLSMVWGRVHAGAAANAIPMEGEAEGTLRCLDAGVWRACGELLPELAEEIVAPYDVTVETEVRRGVPPVVNDEISVNLMREATGAVLGRSAVATTDQSLGGEDFAWYLTHVRGAMARLGVRAPGTTQTVDLHQGTFNVDENAIGVGVRLLVGTALFAVGDWEEHLAL